MRTARCRRSSKWLIFIGIIAVEPRTLLLMILAAVIGAWLGAGLVARLPRRYVRSAWERRY